MVVHITSSHILVTYEFGKYIVLLCEVHNTHLFQLKGTDVLLFTLRPLTYSVDKSRYIILLCGAHLFLVFLFFFLFSS